MQDNATDHDNNIHRKVEDSLDFILSHFEEPLFPRKIMTKQLGYQVEIFNKQEASEHFKSSNYEDCRINAYPSFTEYHGINRTPISFLMVDLDLKDFADETKRGKAELDRVLNKTLQKITAMKKCSLLVLLPLLLLLLLLIFVSHHGIWPVAQIAHADLSGFDNGSGSSIIMHNTPVLLDGLFGYYYYIPI